MFSIILCQSFHFFYAFHSLEVLVTLTTDVGKILTKLHQVQPIGSIRLITGIRIAHVSIHSEDFLIFNKSRKSYKISVSFSRPMVLIHFCLCIHKWRKMLQFCCIIHWYNYYLMFLKPVFRSCCELSRVISIGCWN